jgi:hypothetical protein
MVIPSSSFLLGVRFSPAVNIGFAAYEHPKAITVSPVRHPWTEAIDVALRTNGGVYQDSAMCRIAPAYIRCYRLRRPPV